LLLDWHDTVLAAITGVADLSAVISTVMKPPGHGGRD
jgi:hypothetical protein